MKVTHDYVLLEVSKNSDETVTPGGIVLVDQEKPVYTAEVLSKGPQVSEDAGFEVGDMILVGKKSGDFLHTSGDPIGNPYIVHAADVLVVLD